MPVADLAWAAGFVDGERCFSVMRRHRRTGELVLVLKFSITQVDRRPLHRLAKVLDLQVSGPRNPPSHVGKPFYLIAVTGARVSEVFQQLQPYLSEPKREQFQLCLDKVTPRQI